MAELLADAAADTERLIDDSLTITDADRRAAHLHAGLASAALVGIDMERRSGFDRFKEDTGTAADDNRRFIHCEFFSDSLVTFGEVIRVNDFYPVDAHCVAERFEVDFASRVARDVVTGGRVLLMAGCQG